MYLTALLLGLLFSAASGVWYSALIWLAAYAFVYAQVIPLEESFLRETFGNSYEDYRAAVPRLWPRLRAYAPQSGAFSLREALINETAALIMVPLFWWLYWIF